MAVDPKKYMEKNSVPPTSHGDKLRHFLMAAVGDICAARKECQKGGTKEMLAYLDTIDPKAANPDRSYVRAIEALRQCGPGAKEALPLLKKLKRHPAGEVRKAAGDAVDAIGE
jgi:hypothetical protein